MKFLCFVVQMLIMKVAIGLTVVLRTPLLLIPLLRVQVAGVGYRGRKQKGEEYDGGAHGYLLTILF